jgi:hypothetical protein
MKIGDQLICGRPFIIKKKKNVAVNKGCLKWVGENFGRNTVIYRIKSFNYRIEFLNTDTNGCPRQIFRKWDCGEWDFDLLFEGHWIDPCSKFA